MNELVNRKRGSEILLYENNVRFIIQNALLCPLSKGKRNTLGYIGP